ncbi:MAG: FAD-dependent oxidoreductase, partial [Planctomycetota bacterium]|nr:FAD-dependent oxidoreductase [Planctomycetota bacterium]
EYQPALGGVGTVGMIARYYFGNRVGFTEEIDIGTRSMGPAKMPGVHPADCNIEWKQQWYADSNDRAGTALWFNAIGCGAVVDDGFVRGVLVATPHGIGVVRCSAVVDGSGSADVPAHAGADTEAIDARHVAIQGAGLGPRQPGHQYRNTDWTFIDDNDVVDTTHAMVAARRKWPNEFDLSTLVDSRERRRIKGDVTVSPLDQLAGRTWPDTIVTAHSNFDTHGMTIHPIFMVKPMDKAALDAHVPFRCLLPAQLRNVACTGLGKSAHRDALPVIRMQPDVQNEGYAAGVAAAMAAASTQGDLRSIDMAALQAHLVDIKILAEEVPTHHDSFPLPAHELTAAIAEGTDSYLGLATIFAQGEAALPELRSAFNNATGELRLRYAQILGLLGDATGAAELATAIAGSEWDEGWNYRGMGQYGRCMSPIDDLLVALGTSGSTEHGAMVIDKITSLTAEHHMSHSRAVSEACERLKLTEAAPALAAFLRQDGIAGHHHDSIRAAQAAASPDACDTAVRNVSLRELHLARALYRLGDHQGLGAEILGNYASDLRGVYARHAQAVLAETPALVTV